jgi:hypothetical protein
MTQQPRRPVSGPLKIWLVGGGLAAVLLTGIGLAVTPRGPSASPSSDLAALPPSDSPAPVTSAEPSPSAAAKPTPKPTPKPKPAVWSKSVHVKGLDGCYSVVAAIDERGTNHLAAECGDSGSQIRYSTSIDASHWTTRVFKAPTNRLELDPQLAVKGSTLYLAYTRLVQTEGACGDDGLRDLGAYYRTRKLPNGGWSLPRQIGAVSDHLQSFRVDGSTIHATVGNEKDGLTYYETVSGGTTHRYRLAGASGGTSLRIGDDSMARIAYGGANGIVYGTFDGARFNTTTVPGTKGGEGPTLILAPGNVAYMLWIRNSMGGGCAEPEPPPTDGTYFATNAGGSWTSTKLSNAYPGGSITLDPATRELHVLIGDDRGIVYYNRVPGADWTEKTLVATRWLSSPVIRQNPRTGALLVAYQEYIENSNNPTIQVMTKG